MTAEVLLLALAQAALFFLIGRVVVELVAGFSSNDVGGRETLERWLLACLGFTTWAVVLMLGHIATGGFVFSTTWVVPLATAGLIAVLWWVRGLTFTRPRVSWPVIALGALLVALYLAPAVVGGSSLRTGDPPWHLGWTEQILDGDPVPTGPAPVEFARNAYPWGLHAVFATLVRLVPGSDPLIAHEALHLVLIAAIPLGAAGLARLANRRAGLGAAAVAGLVGGFGWVVAGSPDFVASPTEARYGADLVAASPNSVYELFPPALPRELGLVLLACAGVILARVFSPIARSFGWRRAAVAGAAVGVVGLVSVPMVLSALVWTIASFVIGRRMVRTGAIVIGIALATFSLWALPVAIDFVRFNGFVNVTPRLGVEWPFGVALASWGLLVPLAVVGSIVVATQPPVIRRSLLPPAFAAAMLLGLSIARGRFEWGLLGNETLLHQGRFWPPAHLIASALGGIGLVALFGWLRPRFVAMAVTAAVLIVGALSPLFASVQLTRIIGDEKRGFLYRSGDLEEEGFVRRAAAHLHSEDTINAEASDLLGFYLFQFSGVRMGWDSNLSRSDNPLRIRYKDLAERWALVGSGAPLSVPRSDWLVTTRIAGGGFVETGTFRDERWGLIRSHD